MSDIATLPAPDVATAEPAPVVTPEVSTNRDLPPGWRYNFVPAYGINPDTWRFHYDSADPAKQWFFSTTEPADVYDIIDSIMNPKVEAVAAPVARPVVGRTGDSTFTMS